MSGEEQPDARLRLVQAIYSAEGAGVCFCGDDCCPTPDAMVDDFAHQLAEKIRAELGCERTQFEYGCWGSDCCATAEDAARLIDPEVML